MMLGIPWYAVVAGCALVAGVVTLIPEGLILDLTYQAMRERVAHALE